MIKIGIIGFGKMGQTRAKAFEDTGKAEIVCVYDINNENIAAYQTLGSVDEIIYNEHIDTVVICAPNFLNFKVSKKALEAGKNVFCEKPPAFSVGEVMVLQEVERISGKKLMYGFNHRHHDAVVKIKYLIESGEYGKVLWMRGRYGKSVDESYLSTWRAKKSLAGGGILLDQGIHMLDLFLYLGGSFDQVHAFVSSLYWKMDGIEDNVFAIMKNSKTGVAASLHSTMTQWRHLFSLEIFMESGYLVLNGLKTSSDSYGEEELTVAKNRSTAPAATWSDEERFVFDVDNSWLSEAMHFVDCIENDLKVMEGNSMDALNVMTLVEEIYKNERCESDSLRTDLQINTN